MLTVKIHKKYYGDRLVLNNLEFTANTGEFVAIVAPSGAGKSTLLNIIAGLDKRFSGKLQFNQQPLHPFSKEVHLSCMFQEPRLMPWLSVLENLLLVTSQRAHAEKLLQAVGLQEYLHHYPLQLSGGMQRRVALARAFCIQPHLLLMDEPFISLDAPTAEKLQQILLDLWENQRPTVLFVTHHLEEALKLADRILFLSSAPAQIILSHPVTLNRPRAINDENITQLKQKLMQQYPALLAGKIL